MRLGRTLGVSLGAVELLQNQTVEMLARLIAEQQPATKQEPRIVQLQKGSQEPPLYFIHAGPDEAGLATLMGQGRAVFGIVVARGRWHGVINRSSSEIGHAKY